MDNRNTFFEKELRKPRTISNSHSFTLSVFFVCVTISALVFNNSNLLYWYIVGVFMELIYKGPNLLNAKHKIDSKIKTDLTNDIDRR